MNSFGLTDLVQWLELDFESDDTNCFKLDDVSDKYYYDAICTDTRTLKKGQIFLALRGNNFDGHNFLANAVDLGAGLLIVQSMSQEADMLLQNDSRVFTCDTDLADIKPGMVPVIRVEDTLTAYQKIARGYRLAFRGKVIAVTGSVGKTSTREMVSACLSGTLKIHATRDNLNNEIGLPATILQASSDEDAVILEMGMRGSGEIELLSLIAQPDIAMITNIGWSHIERLGSRDAILRAKCEILSGLNPDGWLILNSDDKLLSGWRLSEHIGQNLFLVSADGKLADDYNGLQLWADQIIVNESSTAFTLRSKTESWPVNLHVPGRHHVRNALFGFAAAVLTGVPIEAAIRGAENYINTGSRQKIIECGSIRIIDDSYNAAPESMLAAIDALALIAGKHRKIAVLGCMLELGEFARELHLEIGRAAALTGVDKLFLIGEFAESVKEGALSVNPEIDVVTFDERSDLSSSLMSVVKNNDHILIKGSRAFQLEKVVSDIIKLQEEANL